MGVSKPATQPSGDIGGVSRCSVISSSSGNLGAIAHHDPMGVSIHMIAGSYVQLRRTSAAQVEARYVAARVV